MKKIVLSVLGATALLSTAAVAAPMNPAAIQSAEGLNIDQVRLVCNEYGRCYRVRGPRYIQRSYGDDGYYVRRGYGYYGGGPYGYYGGGPRYYEGGPGYGYYGGGPSIGFSFGGGGW
jgi:hypothetical protein